MEKAPIKTILAMDFNGKKITLL